MNRGTEALLCEEIEKLDREYAKLFEEDHAKIRSNNGLVFDKRYVGIKFLMKYLDCPEPTLRDWIRLKKIPFFKMGKLIRFDLQRIDQWLKEKAVDN